MVLTSARVSPYSAVKLKTTADPGTTLAGSDRDPAEINLEGNYIPGHLLIFVKN